MDQPRFAVVIEDEPDIRSLITEVLENAGFEVQTAGTGSDGVRLVQELDPLVTTLDISMPGMDGFETARRVREVSHTYIVMLTARAEEVDTLQGLQSGADDYVTKPFRPRELRARVEAMLRRPRQVRQPQEDAFRWPSDDQSLVHDGLSVNRATRAADVEGRRLDLTRSEFEILYDLLSAQGRVVSKEDLALMLRGERHTGRSAYIAESDVRAIEVHMANLRRKIGDSSSDPRWIETVRGVGYRLAMRSR